MHYDLIKDEEKINYIERNMEESLKTKHLT